MTAALIVALVLAIPVILFPVAYIWYINIGGLAHAVREARQAKATQKELATEKAKC